MASSVEPPGNGQYFIVDLITTTDPFVATVPDFWVINGSQCWYPKTFGSVAAEKRKTPKKDWLLYPCVVRRTFHSYEASRARENVAVLQSDINSASETQQNMGKGHRHKRPNKRYLQDISTDSSSDDSSVGVYGPTQLELPSIPAGLTVNAAGPSRRVVNCRTQSVQQSAKFSQSLGVHSSFDASSMAEDRRFTIERSNPLVLQSQHSSELFDLNSPLPGPSSTSADRRVIVDGDQVHVAQPTTQCLPVNSALVSPSMLSNDYDSNDQQAKLPPVSYSRDLPAPANNTEGLEKMVKKLVREVLKQQENIANVMEKLIVIEGKMDNLVQPVAITPPDNPTLFLEPLKEIEEMKKMEENLLDEDNYFQLVRMIRNLGGASVRDALKRAWYSIFSIKVMANVNWEGKPKKGSQQKQGLMDSVITKAVFAGITTATRKPNKFEMENDTRKIMRGMPDKYRRLCAAEKDNAMEVDNGSANGPQPGI